MHRSHLESSDLRERAEAELALKGGLAVAQDVDAIRTAHELQVHKIELELQNEELVRSNHALDSLRVRYQSFYDDAPVGYFTLSSIGNIAEFNACAARMLKREPAALLGVPMRLMFAAESQPAFNVLVDGTTESDVLASADQLLLQRAPGVPMFVKAQARRRVDPTSGEMLVLLVIMDVTALKFAMDDVVSTLPK